MNALLTTSLLTLNAQEHLFTLWLTKALSEAAPGLVINRYHDATPLLLRYGRLVEQLYESARYLVQVDGKWKAVPYHDMMAIKGCARSVPGSGVLEVLAQAAEVTYSTSGAASASSADLTLLLPPCILENTKASTLYRAYEQASADLSLEGLKKISEAVRVFVLGEVPDSAPSNVR